MSRSSTVLRPSARSMRTGRSARDPVRVPGAPGQVVSASADRRRRVGRDAPRAGSAGGAACVRGHGARFRPPTRRELGCVGRDLAGARSGRRAGAVAGDARRRVLLPTDLRSRLVARQHVVVRARLLAELPLLPRSRHVGHRDVRRSAARPDQPGCGPISARVPSGTPAGGSPQRVHVGLPRGAVSLGEQPSITGRSPRPGKAPRARTSIT